jgi:translation initiation factor IF-1
MQKRASVAGRVAAASGLALLLSVPAAAQNLSNNGYYNNNGNYAYQNGRIAMEGRITSMTRHGSTFDVRLDNGGYLYNVARSTVRSRGLRVGEVVRLEGYANGGAVTVDNVMLASDPNWSYRGNPNSYPNGMYSGSTYGMNSANFMTGIVESTNRHYNYITVRDANTGQRFKVDVRQMDTGRSVNVWRLRPGDRVAVNGGWENSDTFQANTVNY